MTNNNAETASAREIQISEWITHEKNTCRGFFTATLPSGMVLRDLSLHKKDDKRWINAPQRQYKDENGNTRYANIIAFINEPTAERFRDAILAALDRHLAEIKTRR